jgi:hypothetical protein
MEWADPFAFLNCVAFEMVPTGQVVPAFDVSDTNQAAFFLSE